MTRSRRYDPEWEALRERFRRVVSRRGADRVADDIPADRATVFRLINGRSATPTLAVRVGIQRVVEEREQQEGEWSQCKGK